MAEDFDKELWLVAFGQIICERRNYIAMTQQTLADHSGVHRTYISDIERGSRNITVSTANRIAAALETTAAKLFVQTDKRSAQLEKERDSK